MPSNLTHLPSNKPKESVDEIRDRLTQALGHIDANRLVAAPDCGLGLLRRELALAKLRNLSQAVRTVIG